MSKQKPEYYQTIGGLYVALNRSAVRMFKKKNIKYIRSGQFIDIKSMLPLKDEKGE